MKRIYIPNTGADPENVKEAYAHGLVTCAELGVKELTIIVPTRGSPPEAVAESHFGRAGARTLAKGEAVHAVEDIYIRCESVKTLPKRREPEVVLAFYVSPEDMDIIDALHSPKVIIYVPWIDEKESGWQRAWNAEIPGQEHPDKPPVLDSRLEDAIQRLTNHINLSTGLTHPLDLQDAKMMFADLQHQGVKCDPVELRIWALRNNWRPRHVYDLTGVTHCDA